MGKHLGHNQFFRTGPDYLSLGMEKEILDSILDIDPANENNIDTNSFDLVQTKQDTTDTIMTISFSDPKYLSKVQQIEDFSNYLIPPLRKSYKVFHLSLTLVFTAIDKFLTVSKAQTDSSKTKVVQNLLKIKKRV